MKKAEILCVSLFFCLKHLNNRRFLSVNLGD